MTNKKNKINEIAVILKSYVSAKLLDDDDLAQLYTNGAAMVLCVIQQSVADESIEIHNYEYFIENLLDTIDHLAKDDE